MAYIYLNMSFVTVASSVVILLLSLVILYTLMRAQLKMTSENDTPSQINKYKYTTTILLLVHLAFFICNVIPAAISLSVFFTNYLRTADASRFALFYMIQRSVEVDKPRHQFLVVCSQWQ